MFKNVCVLILVSLSVLLTARMSLSGSPEEITVSAAMSLKNAFEEIGKAYHAKTGNKAVFNFGASGSLARQIEAGAPVDVFASAALKDMDSLQKNGLIDPDTRNNFAGNTIVLIVPAQSRLEIQSFDDLKRTEVKRIAIGDPKTVPAGRYAEEIISYYAMTTAVKDKLIFTKNVRQALDYAARGEVDAAIVYASDAAVRASEVKIAAIALQENHTPVIYPIAAIKNSKKMQAANAFIEYVLSAEGIRILQKHGFKTVK